jgi:hypothetical protein
MYPVVPDCLTAPGVVRQSLPNGLSYSLRKNLQKSPILNLYVNALGDALQSFVVKRKRVTVSSLVLEYMIERGTRCGRTRPASWAAFATSKRAVL